MEFVKFKNKTPILVLVNLFLVKFFTIFIYKISIILIVNSKT